MAPESHEHSSPAHDPFVPRLNSTPQTKYYCPLDCDSGPSNKFLIKSASTPYKYWSGREGDCNANSPAVSLLSDKSEATTFQSQNLSKGNGDVDYTQFLLPDKQAKGSCPRVPSAYAWPSPDALKEGHLAVTGINDIDDDFELTQFRVYPIDIEDTACEGPVIIRSKEGKKYLSMNKMSDFELKTTNPNKATRWLIDFKSSGQCS